MNSSSFLTMRRCSRASVGWRNSSTRTDFQMSRARRWRCVQRMEVAAANGCLRPILLKNCSRLGQRGVAGGHKPSPERVAFNSGRSMRLNFAAVPAPLRQTSFSTE